MKRPAFWHIKTNCAQSDWIPRDQHDTVCIGTQVQRIRETALSLSFEVFVGFI